MTVLVPVSWGELIDKITILTIKAERFTDPVKARHVAHELALLTGTRDRALDGAAPPPAEVAATTAELAAVNRRLWDVEDELRACEARNDFGSGFVALARSVYLHNDRRAALKRKLNELLGSEVFEEKQHPAY